MYKRLQNLLVRCHKPTLTKPPSHSLMLIDYSDTSCPPNAPAVAQVLKSSKIMSTVSPSFLFCHDPKILAFLCFQSVQHISITNVLNPFQVFLWICFLASDHHCTNLESYAGQSSILKPILAMQRNHTCRENMHYCKMWSTMSSSWSHK